MTSFFKKKHGVLDISKLTKVLSTLKPEDYKYETLIVLVISGSFNPVHSQHVETLRVARAWMENKEKCTVVGGFLSASSDEYVAYKLGPESMILSARNDMCNLACADSEWISTCGWGWANGGHTTQEIEREISITFPAFKFQALEVCGADHAAKSKPWRKKSMICIGRPGYTTLVKRTWQLDQQKFFKFYLVEQDLKDVSSTAIRQKLSCLQNEKDKDWSSLNSLLGSKIVKYLASHHVYHVAPKTIENKEEKPIPGALFAQQAITTGKSQEGLSKSQKRRARKHKSKKESDEIL